MGTIRRSKSSSERKNWDKIFSALVQMLETQQTQLETLVKERKLLEDRIKLQHDRLASDTRLYEDLICQMKGDLVIQDMERALEESKLDLLVGLKQRDTFLCQLKSEQIDNELQDFKELFSLLSSKISDPSGIPLGNSLDTAKTIKEVGHSETVDSEVQKLRQAYKKLASEKSSEVSALLAEKTFVWNQYNIMENDYKSKLKDKCSEVELAHTKIENLLANMERLQSLNNVKDDMIAALETQVGKMETDSTKLNDEISRISHELEFLRKHTGTSVTPVLNRCTSGTKSSDLAGKKRGKDSGSNIIVKKEASSTQAPRRNRVSEKEDGTLKRERDVTCESETPKLFTSSFKPPKLKSNMYV